MLQNIIHTVDEILEKRHIMLGILIFLFILSILPRLYRIDNPIADWHSWRQADTAAITRNFIKEGFTPLFPKFDSLNSLNENQEPNPHRYFFAEFPIYNIIVYPFYYYFGVNEVYHRAVSVFFASLTTVFLYLLTRKLSGNTTALIAAFFFAILPYNIYYGRVTMADPLHIFFGVLTLYLVAKWSESKNLIWPILAGLATTFTILTKPYGLVLGLPIGYMLLRGHGLKLFTSPGLYLYAIISFAPFFAWRWHINQHPEGMFGTTWLYNQGDIRFTGAYFRWILFDRLNRLIFATGGFVLFFLGLAKSVTKKEGYIYHVWLAGILVFFVVIAKGNVTHDYYQLPIVPVGCILMARGLVWLITIGKGFIQNCINVVVAISLVLMMIGFGWYEVRGYFNVNRSEIVEIGKVIDELTPKNAKIIAPYMNDPAFLYQTNRYGWTNGGGLIPFYVKEGADYLAVVDFDSDSQYWIDRCKIIAESKGRWVLVDVKQCHIEEEVRHESN
ncbi:MAG TPA: glycosyltransferase family 39 protein [Candidatus Woesebacteria bacterium]|nr:glycosyltransferase family 39 protein [Candidatus Woesebacteria bacterium]